MKFINKKLILFICIICAFFGFANNAKADYQTFGLFISTNLLVSSGSEIINSFSYTITIPTGTTASVQFSLDNATWYNSSGVLDGSNTLSAGTNTIDLSARAWSGSSFYYRMTFTSDGANTPALDSITLSYIDFSGVYNIYSTTGSFTSTNLLSLQTAVTIENFVYNLTSLPPNTTATAQFSLDNATWYNSSGVLNSSNTLSAGTNTIDLSGLSWSGSSFYYKINLTSDSTYTPILDSIILNYTYIPTLTGISTSPNPIKGGETITITPTGQGDANSNALNYYCNETGSPTSANTLCSQANASYTSPYSTMTCTYAVTSGDETRNVYCRTYDGTDYSIERTSTCLVDSTAPITTADAGAYTFDTWTNVNVIVILACADGSGSGCSATLYCTDIANICVPNLTYTTAVTISTQSTSYIRYASTDIVSNTETIKSQTIKIDTGGTAINAGTDKTVKAQFTQDAVVTAGDSPVASYLWSKVSGTGTISFGTPTSEDTTISSDTDGTFVIKLTVTDMAGNSNSDTMTLVWDTIIPTRSSVSPASTSTITDSTQTVTFTTSENATCYVSTDGDEAYTNMSDDTLCAGGGTTSQSCITPTLIEGTNYVYIACTDGTNPDTIDTNERLIYNLNTTTLEVQSAGGNSMMLLVLQAQAKTKEQSQVYTQEQKQILIAQLKVKLIELIQQLILLLQEQARNR